MWKVLGKLNDGYIHYITPIVGMTAQLGEELCPTNPIEYINLSDCDTVHDGVIHVFTSRKAARHEKEYYIHDNKCVIKCRANLADLVGCSKGEACFKKIKLGYSEKG